MSELWESCVAYHWGTCKWQKDQCVKDKCPWVDLMFKLTVIADKLCNIEKDMTEKIDDTLRDIALDSNHETNQPIDDN